MTTKSDIIAAIQAAADATGVNTIRIGLGTPGSRIADPIGEMKDTGAGWVPEPKVWPTVIAGIAAWIDAHPSVSHDPVTLDAVAQTLLSLSTQELGLVTQNPGKVFAGPVRGIAATPTFRDLEASDIPAITVFDYCENPPSTPPDGTRCIVMGKSNLCVDGDMEAAGTAAYLSTHASLSKDAFMPIGGAQCLKVLATGAGGARWPQAYQNILSVGQDYLVNGWAWSDGTQIPKVYVTGNGAVWTGTNDVMWQEITASFTAMHASLKLQFNINGPAGTEFVRFDDIVVRLNDAFTGHDNEIATYDAATDTWSFAVPDEGLLVWVEDDDEYYYWDGSAWSVFSAVGPPGPDGNPGAAGGSLRFFYDAAVGFPVNGFFTFDNADPTLATKMYISDQDGSGGDVQDWEQLPSGVGSVLTIYKLGDYVSYLAFQVGPVIVDHAGYWEYAVTLLAHYGVANIVDNDPCFIGHAVIGAAGADGADGHDGDPGPPGPPGPVPLTEQGSLVYAGALAAPTELFHGTDGQLLRTYGHAADPNWWTPGTMASEAASDYVAKASYDAQSILAATLDNTPAALTIGEQTLVGRKTGGNVEALSALDARTVLGLGSMALAATGDYVANAAYDAQTILAATLDNTPAALVVGEQTVVGRITGGNVAALSSANL